MAQVPPLLERLQSAGLNDVKLIVGGIIPEQDVAALKKLGVAAVFTPGTSLAEITGYVRSAVGTRGDRRVEGGGPEN